MDGAQGCGGIEPPSKRQRPLPAQTLKENNRRGVKSRKGARQSTCAIAGKLTVSEMLERADLRVRIATEKKVA